MSRIYLSAPDQQGDESELVRDALASNWIAPLGPHVDAFERELATLVDMPYALALSSGTAALHLALKVIGVTTGDTVWCSSLTFAASANAIVYCGATPVFVDSNLASWNIDPALLAESLAAAAASNSLPKALIAVDLYGQCADYEPIVELSRRYNVVLIEDAAEALGATYKGRPAGSFADLSILSFNGNKIITTSGGGMLLSKRQDWLEHARHLSTQAREKVRHYEHKEIGYNYRLSNLLAAVGRAQLRDLSRRVARRREINDMYRTALSAHGWSFMPQASYGTCTFWLSCATIDSAVFGATRDQIIDVLEKANIEARPVWKPLHLQPVFAEAKVFGGAVAQQLFDYGICLPSGSALKNAEINRVISAIVEMPRTRPVT